MKFASLVPDQLLKSKTYQCDPQKPPLQYIDYCTVERQCKLKYCTNIALLFKVFCSLTASGKKLFCSPVVRRYDVCMPTYVVF